MKLIQSTVVPFSAGAIKMKSPEDLRCACGNLMALIKKEGIELKCRRCKRKSLIPLNGIAEDVKRLWPELLRTK